MNLTRWSSLRAKQKVQPFLYDRVRVEIFDTASDVVTS